MTRGSTRSEKSIGLAAHLRELAKRPEGFACPEVQFKAKDVSCQAAYLVNAGQLFRAKISHKRVRFFDCPKRAEEYEQAHKSGRRARTSTNGEPWEVRAPWGGRARWANEPRHPGGTPESEMVFTKNTKHTIVPQPYRPSSMPIRTNTHSAY
jgi:hypothetical protein